jgi:hypothetical protein
MSINSISGNNPYGGMQSLFSQPNQDFQSLATDLNSGNLAGAQKDLAALQQDVTSSFSSLLGSNSAIPASNTSTGPTADLQALKSALNSNDLAGAQKSFAAFQQDVRGFGMHRGHHRHHDSDSDGDTQQNGNGNTAGGNSTSNSNGNNGVPDFTMGAMLAAYRAFGSNGLSVAPNTLSVVA